MKKIDFKNPRYVLPLICLPFFMLLFFVYRSYSSQHSSQKPNQAALQSEVSPAANAVQDKAIEDKLEAFKQRYKKGDGYTALATVEGDQDFQPEEISSAYSLKEKRMLDSISQVLKSKKSPPGPIALNTPRPELSRPRAPAGGKDEELNVILKAYANPSAQPPVKQKDPMAVFRAQMAIVDSMNKASLERSSYSQPMKKVKAGASPVDSTKRFKVEKSVGMVQDNSTILAGKSPGQFIQAMVDESLTGLSGSRVRLRLMSEVNVAGKTLPKGSSIYALISGFSSQRVQLSISTIFFENQILPVKLEVYDLDGLKGLYVPSSSYREFSRELGESAIAGIGLESSGEQNQQLMSTLGRMFQSTTGAITKLMRSNKVRLRYPTLVYLIDASQLKT